MKVIKLIPVCIAVCLCYNASGQRHRILDSLQTAFATKPTQERIQCFVEEAILYYNHNTELALEIVRDAEGEALLCGDSALLVSCWRFKGQILNKLERSNDAIATFERALPVAIRNGLDREQMRILVSSGISHLFRSEYDKALHHFFGAQEIATYQSDSSYQEMILSNIGIIYYKLQDYKKALLYWKEGLRLEQFLNRKAYEYPVNISMCYANLHDFQNAKRYLEEAIDACGMACSDQAMVHIKYASGYIRYLRKEYHQAEQEFLASYKYAFKVGDIRMKLDNIYLLTDVYVQDDRIDEALMLLNEAEGLIRDGATHNLEIIKIYARLAETSFITKDFKRAAGYCQAKYIALKDSIYSDALTTSLMKVESEQLNKMNRARIAAQEEVIRLKGQVITHQQSLNLVVGTLAVMIFVSSIFIYRSYRLKRDLNLRLDQRVRERTAELESAYHESLRFLKEQEIAMQRLSSKAVDSFRTIHGLCAAARSENEDAALRAYFLRIEEIVKQPRIQMK